MVNGKRNGSKAILRIWACPLAEASGRRKGSPYQSAMSMLTFYINRAGSQLDDGQREVLEQAKDELRRLFGKD